MLMDKDDSGSLSHQEILGAVKTNAEVKKFLNDCGDRNLQYLLMPSKLEASLKAIDSDGSGEIELPEWEAAIETALKAKLAQRAADRERRAKEAAAEIAAFTAEFLNAARKVFEMIDKDDSGALAKAEIVEAVKSDEEVKDFLQNCGEETCSSCSSRSAFRPRAPAARHGQLGRGRRRGMYCCPASYLSCVRRSLVDVRTGEEAIHRGLKKRLEQLADERERRERAAAAADEEFSAGFLNAARDVFIMMDKDDSGTLTKEEILHAVKTEDEVQKFLISCGNQNLSDLMVPSEAREDARRARHGQEWRGGPARVVRLSESGALETFVDAAHRSMFHAGRRPSRKPSRTSSSSGPRTAPRRRRRRARRTRPSRRSSSTRRARCSSSSTRDDSGSAGDRRDYAGRQVGRGRQGLPQDVRRRDAHVPAAAEAARPRAARARHGRLGRGRHRRVYGPASDLSRSTYRRCSLVDSRAGRRRSAGACRSASSSSPTSASAASAPRPRRTRPFRPNSCSPRARSS